MSEHATRRWGREVLDRRAQVVLRAGTGGHDGPNAPLAGDPAEAAEVRRGHPRCGRCVAGRQLPRNPKLPPGLGAVIECDLLVDARVEVGQALDDVVALSIRPEVAHSTVDHLVASGVGIEFGFLAVRRVLRGTVGGPGLGYRGIAVRSFCHPRRPRTVPLSARTSLAAPCPSKPKPDQTIH
jgi:hypothetical protein